MPAPLRPLPQPDRAAAAARIEAGWESPSRVRGKAPREAIHWSLRATRLGPLAMAATARGVCFVQFGDDAAALAATLTREFPKARLLPSHAASDGASSERAPLDAWIDALEAHLDAAVPAPELPLDLRGTAFQMRVWRFLQGIPLGVTRSYAEVAAGIGAPKATRAVGTACGANRVAVLVPCHRVLRGDGSLGGYRGGLERKRALLAAEVGSR